MRFALLLVALMGCDTRSVEPQARDFLSDLAIPESVPFDCAVRDTDGDGYVSCTVMLNGELTPFECSRPHLIFPKMLPASCRKPKLAGFSN